jgi:metallophosphoesterase superfamily enzyme
VRTLVVSDLHLGAASRADLLRRAELREPLLDALQGVDRLVILGDGLELRDRPQREAGEVAAPLFAQLGRALGADGELVLTAGNHDHGLIAGWIDGRLLTEPSGFLGLEHRIPPEEVGPLAAALAGHAAPARVTVAYPGMWLRDDVYAIHGHYCDVHTTVPTFERLATGAMARWVVDLPDSGATPDDYEAVLAPMYAWMHALTQRSDHALLSAGAGASARAWVALAGGSRHRRPLRMAALGAGYTLAVAALNALGIGPLDRNLSGAALRRGGLRGFAEVLRRLGVTAPYAIWGHSHRSGPWPGDDEREWTTAAGTRILNAGSWVYQRHFLSDEPNVSPYWPGTGVVVEDEGPPRLIRLLGDRGHEELQPRA